MATFASMWNPFKRTPLPEAWKTLENMNDLNAAIQESHDRPVVLFKHSTSCSRSAFAYSKLTEQYDIDPKKAQFYYLDLLTFRPISNAIASELKVMHQSPQIIVLKNGKATFDTSHEAITYKGLQQAVS